VLAAKDYFKHYLADDVVRQLNRDLVQEILKYKPENVFEFGCGQGKNLALINPVARSMGIEHVDVIGIDLSIKAVYEARQKGRKTIYPGDETLLAKLPARDIDVCFTCSVLDHIEHEITVDHILSDLKRMSEKAVILYETQRHTPNTYYYYHDYESYGFTKLDYEYISSERDGGDGSLYSMWVWEREIMND
jgi:ubiquinone/menaquinone biosynthesis C-methylase UbiE